MFSTVNSPAGSLLHCSLTKLLRACMHALEQETASTRKRFSYSSRKGEKLERILYVCMHACSFTWPTLKCNNCHLIEKLNN